MVDKRWAWVALAGALTVAVGCTRSEQSDRWPSQPVKIIVPFGAGASADLAARLFAPRLAGQWQKAVVVDNRPGGDGGVGVQAFVAANDQHTLFFAPMGIVTVNPLLHDSLPFDPMRDVVPIAAAGRTSIGIAVTTSTAVMSLSDLVALVRQRPDHYLWAATAGMPELVFRAFLELEQLRMRHVPYRDIVPAVHDLGAARIHLIIAALPTLSSALDAGSARLLAVTTLTRSPAAPEVPTTGEAGYPGLSTDGTFGFFGWRGISDDLRNVIAADVQRAAQDPALVSRLARVGFIVGASTPAEFAQAVEEQRTQVASLVRIVGLKTPPAKGR